MAESSDGKSAQYLSEVRQFRLYVAGQTPKSLLALANLKNICARYLQSPYRIEVVDVLEEAERAAEDRVIAVPTLLQLAPGPLRRVVGDLSDTARVLEELDLAEPGRFAAEDPPPDGV